jgi:uncharacterized protein
MRPRRILSIDGGGIKGAFPAAFLAAIERALELASVADYFDLVAGTSIGGIIALGLGLGFTAQRLSEFFVDIGPRVFPANALPKGKVRLVCGIQRHRSEPLRAALTELFDEKKLGDSRVRLLIPAFDATKADIHIYKTCHHPRLGMDHRVSAVEVAMATAAAPTYFPKFDSENCITLIDGGVWANDPTALAVVEAISVLGWAATELEVLSIGCTEEAIDFKERGHGGIFWIRRGIAAALRGQTRSAQGMARHLTGKDQDLERVIRINPIVQEERFRLDDASGIQDLKGFAYSEARHALPMVKRRFFSEKAETFSPFEGCGDEKQQSK